MNNRKILIYNQYYSPLNNPPAKRLTGLAEYLKKKGWDVMVVTGMPNYPDGVLKKGYRRIFKREILNGVRVYRTAELPLKSAGFIRRLVNYLSFALTSLITIPMIITSGVVIISTPPLISAIPYFYICKLFRKKVVLDVRDLWPESILEVTSFKNGLIYKIFLAISNDMYKNAWKVVCVTNKMAEIVRTKGAQNVCTITNFTNSKELSTRYDIGTKNGDVIKIAYTGMITKIQNLGAYIQFNSNKNIRRKFEWHIVGDGEELANIKSLVETESYDNVYFYGYKNSNFCKKIIEASDICLAGLQETELTRMTLPSKFIDYASYGKPIISNWSDEIRSLYTKYKFGLFVDTLSQTVVVDLLLSLNKDQIKLFSYESIRMFKTEFIAHIALSKYLKILGP